MTEISTVTGGIEIARHRNGHSMKKNRQILKPRSRLSLGDLILVHAVTNLALSLYVIGTGRWEFWM